MNLTADRDSPSSIPVTKSLYSVDSPAPSLPHKPRSHHQHHQLHHNHLSHHHPHPHTPSPHTRPASVAAMPGRHSAARAASRSTAQSSHHKTAGKPFPSAHTPSAVKHTPRHTSARPPPGAGHAKAQSLSTTPRHAAEGTDVWGAPHLARSSSDAGRDPHAVAEATSYVTRRSAATSSSMAVLPDGSVTRTHARTLSGSLRSYAASWIPPQLQAAASTAGRMTPTAGLRIPGLPSLSRRTSPDLSEAVSSSTDEATDKESEGMLHTPLPYLAIYRPCMGASRTHDYMLTQTCSFGWLLPYLADEAQAPALRRSRSAMSGEKSFPPSTRSSAVYHRAHRSYSHTQTHGFVPHNHGSAQRPSHPGPSQGYLELRQPHHGTVNLPRRPASAQLVRSRGPMMASVQRESLPVPTLDLRRLDQAVSLAVDAAQTADENEARRQCRSRARSRQTNADADAPDAIWNEAFPSSQFTPDYIQDGGMTYQLPMPERSDLADPTLAAPGPPIFDDDPPAALGSSLGSDVSTGTTRARDVRSRIGRFLSLPRDSAAGAATLLRNYAYGPALPTEEELAARAADEEEIERRQDAELSLDLYISSLSFLLSALPPKEAMGVSEKHRSEMRATLMEALRKLETSGPVGTAVAASNSALSSFSSGPGAPVDTGTREPSAEALAMHAELAALRSDLQTALNTIAPQVSAGGNKSSTSGTPRRGNTYASTPTVHHIHTHTVSPDVLPPYNFGQTGHILGAGAPYGSLGTNRTENIPADDTSSPPATQQPSISGRPGWSRRVVNSVTWGAVDAGLALSAGAVHLTAKAVSWALPTTLSGNTDSNVPSTSATDTNAPSDSAQNGPAFSTVGHSDQTHDGALATQPSPAHQDLTRSQWDFAIQLASSAVHALSASVTQGNNRASEESKEKPNLEEELLTSETLVRRQSSPAPAFAPEESCLDSDTALATRRWPVSAAGAAASWVSDRARTLGMVDNNLTGAAMEEHVIRLAADLGRAVKRSALPAQLGLLMSRLLSALQALDQRYTLREKTTKLALKNVASALRLARTYQLHIFAARAAAASVEAVVAAIEAYRDERTPPAAAAAAAAAAPPTTQSLSTLKAAAALLAQAQAWQAPPPVPSPSAAVSATPQVPSSAVSLVATARRA